MKTRANHPVGCKHICCMGTTGLVSWVAAHEPGRRLALAKGAAIAVLRYRGQGAGVERFKRAVENERQRLRAIKPQVDAAWAVIETARKAMLDGEK